MISEEITKIINKILKVKISKVERKILKSIKNFNIKNNFITREQNNFLKKIAIKTNIKIKKNKHKRKNKYNKNLIVKNLSDKSIKIYCPKEKRIIDKVKKLHNRRWNSGSQYWSATKSIDNISYLIKIGFTVDKKVKNYLKKQLPKRVKKLRKIKGLKGKPKKFQKRGIELIESFRGRALISDGMGLGKTFQSIAWCQLNKDKKPILIVCPATIKHNWHREIIKFLGNKNIQILNSRTPYKICGEFVIINYEICNYWKKELINYGFKIIIIDESQKIKNPKAYRTKAICGYDQKIRRGNVMKKIHFSGIGESIDHVLCLSGTPMKKRPVDLYTVINLINPNVFPSFWRYAKKYCDAKNNGYGWDFTGAKNIKQLHKILVKNMMIRRKREDVLPELPKKTRIGIPIEITNKTEYKNAQFNVIKWITENKGIEKAERAERAIAFAKINTLKQIAVKGKTKESIKWVTDTLENMKLVIFSAHTPILDTFEKEFKEICVRIDGKTSRKKRIKAEDEFNNNPKIKLLIGNIIAAGVGLNLHKSCYATCFLEFGDNATDHEQAEDRVLRIGTEADAVFAYYLIGKGTIDEDLLDVLEDESKIINKAIDGNSIDSKSMFTKIIKKMKSHK